MTQIKAGGLEQSHFFNDVCVLGSGVTGQAVVRYLLGHRELFGRLTVYGNATSHDAALFLCELPSDVVVLPDAQEVTGAYDLCVVSPGIPPHSALFNTALAASRELIGEPELAWRLSPERWIAVTGTNGKTTTTALITHILNSCGIAARAVGNIGRPCIEAIAERGAGEWLVAELSSYQLYTTRCFAPDAAVLLNITPDHLSWHGSHAEYVQAKLRLFAHLAPDAPGPPLALLDTSTPEAAALFAELQQRGLHPQRISDVRLLLRDCDDPIGDSLRIKGPHNLTNAKAASAVAAWLGLPPRDVATALASFEPLEHRFQPLGEVAGVAFINDSKATNTDAALAALRSFDKEDSVIALFGGRDKNTELDELVTACRGVAKAVICYGEAGERFFASFSDNGDLSCELVPHLSDAFERACARAESGDTVLLAPACASFDEFITFEQRGAVFQQMVREHAAAIDKGVDKTEPSLLSAPLSTVAAVPKALR
ncbi:MAG: UDP-N-acetylmuramoyl-L-alanine--D-glutamate ligase [Coriobacteriales bacterium]|nr:UDP-N-acetylmuramoyl-L-alanine--D-glutamate ligase [Coriobacteriales bacterium]